MNIKTLVAMSLLAAAGLRAEEYNIDSAHSKAGFSVKHMMVSNVQGAFGKISGKISYDQNNPAALRVTAVIDASTVNTNEPKRDEHLRSADFFDVAKFPTMTFASKSARKTGDGVAITGDLTMHGVTKEVVLNVAGPTAEIKDPMGMMRRGATATVTINRSDFGLTWNKALEAGGVMVSDAVTITIDVEGARPAQKN